ncbi:MAG TPA: SIS domain-containing protein, partial [Patescibacteria group bacterium]|nr:SIS domain-containing protein [Patescibacteria group bacterium]
SHWQAMYSSMAKENDVVIAFSNSGSNKDLMESIEIAKKNKVKIILITGNGRSPIAKISDIVLVSYGEESMFKSEAMESRMTALMLVDCLYVRTAMKMQEVTLNTLQKIREGIAVKRF